MRCVYLALIAAYELTWKCGIIVIAVALLAAMNPGEGEGGLDDPTEPKSTRLITATRDECVQVIMEASKDGISSKCMLLDEDGRQLFQAAYDRSGSLWVRWGDAFACQPCGTATRDGSISLAARSGMHRFEFLLRPKGVSGVRTCDYERDEYRGLGYTEEGELSTDPWEVGTTARQESSSFANQVAAERSRETTTSCPSANSAPPGSRATAVVPANSIVSKTDSP